MILLTVYILLWNLYWNIFWVFFYIFFGCFGGLLAFRNQWCCTEGWWKFQGKIKGAWRTWCSLWSHHELSFRFGGVSLYVSSYICLTIFVVDITLAKRNWQRQLKQSICWWYFLIWHEILYSTDFTNSFIRLFGKLPNHIFVR